MAILVRIVFSWTGLDPENPIAQFVNEVTEPVLAPIRQLIPRIGMFDLSPMIASFLLFALINVGERLKDL